LALGATLNARWLPENKADPPGCIPIRPYDCTLALPKVLNNGIVDL
jgi:hypothetical protein